MTIICSFIITYIHNALTTNLQNMYLSLHLIFIWWYVYVSWTYSRIPFDFGSWLIWMIKCTKFFNIIHSSVHDMSRLRKLYRSTFVSIQFLVHFSSLASFYIAYTHFSQAFMGSCCYSSQNVLCCKTHSNSLST